MNGSRSSRGIFFIVAWLKVVVVVVVVVVVGGDGDRMKTVLGDE
jgi:hypothetical protein